MNSTSTKLFLIAAVALAACGNKQETQKQNQALPYPVIEVAEMSTTVFGRYPANLEGITNSAVRAKVAGYVTDVLVDEGERVKKGQTLFKLEAQSLSQEAQAAQATVNAAQVELDKLLPLAEDGIISEVQVETARAQLQKAKSTYNSIAASIDYANIKSHVDGYVGSIPFREGSLVSPSDPQPLTTVSKVDEIYAFFAMNERQYLEFLQNTPGDTRPEKLANFPKVKLEMVNGKNYEFEGAITTVTGQVSSSTGTVSFRATFPNPEGILANGNSGTVLIPQNYEKATIIPEASSFEQQGKTFVFKSQGDTVAVAAPIEVMARVNNRVVIESGLKPGDKIVGLGVGKLRTGMPIIGQPASIDSLLKTSEPVFR